MIGYLNSNLTRPAVGPPLPLCRLPLHLSRPQPHLLVESGTHLMYLGLSSPRPVPSGCYPNWDSIYCGVCRNTPASPNTFVVPDCWFEGEHVQCGVHEVGLSDQPGHEALVPVLGVVTGPWEAVGGWRRPAHLELRGSLESGFPHLQPPTPCEMSLHGLGFPLSVKS